MDNLKANRTADLNGHLWGQRARDWARLQEPVHLPIYEESVRRAGLCAGTDLFDAGCGAGLAMQVAAKNGATVCGLDASEALLAIARERVPGGDFQHGDLENLPFADDSFDVVTAFNSLQYAGSPGAALAEVARVLRPSGLAIIATWGEPEGMEAARVVSALKPLLPPSPPGTPGPFALSGRDALFAFAREAGLEPEETFDVDAPFIYPDRRTALRALSSTGVAARAIEVVGEEAVERAQDVAISPFVDENGRVHISAQFRCLIARPKQA
ncbi:class I SAM-dependent methyltransferase [Martelella alba]|uniref:Class I SAM-dependent methyltransferase n=1 Tax=Martelella alba TaxID=2590451 RepID=A0A506TZY4_9HYPH|nr:class I SAM-dependent methyltransferase [Martelella alba]TPW26285.1 class I SAM-dependent methyltransferase [Martelella alba]